MSIDTLGDLIGVDLANDLTPAQRGEVTSAARENPTGLVDLIHRLEANPNVRSVVPVLLAEIRKGKHHAPPQVARAGRSRERNAVDFAEQRYLARIAKYPDWGQEHAIEYAVDFTLMDVPNAGMTSYELEAALRQRLGLSTPQPAPPPKPRHLRVVSEVEA